MLSSCVDFVNLYYGENRKVAKFVDDGLMDSR